MKQPVVAVCEDIMRGVTGRDMRLARVGATLNELAPVTDKPVVCTINGGYDYLLRKDWDYEARPDDIIIFVIDPPQDRDMLRGLLQIAITVLSIIYPIFGAFTALIGNVLLNALLPPTQAQQTDSKSASPTYSTSLSGNQARLDDCIQKICGRHRIVPPFAAQPYFKYDENGDQYYYALFAVGVGNHVIERELIDDTDIRHFADVLTHSYLAPGVAPAVVLANVVTASEIANQDMKSGKFIGGFSACGPRLTATAIDIDVVAGRGLGYGNDDGGIDNLSVTWRVDVRAIDDFGAPLTSWSVLATETKTAATNEAQRWTFHYVLSSSFRPEVRVVRTDTRNDSIRALHDIQWAGLRSYLSLAAPLNEHTAHYEVVLRASEQLSQLSQRQIALIAQAKCRTWHPVTGWGPEIHTRNAAWWLADLWTSTSWGEGLDDSRIDLQSLYDLSLIWDERQDRFDYVFDTTLDAWEAAQTIARSGRARVFRRNGVNTIARDAAFDLPVHAFTPRNTVPDSMVLTVQLPTRESADGHVIEYFDNRSWDWRPIECPCPGFTVTDVTDPRYDSSLPMMSRPIRKRMPGITGATHAEREGLYESASLLYRNRKVKCRTEMQGTLVAYMRPVRWQPEIVGYGQTGDVAFWDEDSLVMGLTEPPVWGASPNYLTLIRDDGSLTDPVLVTPGPTEWDVTLPSAPDFDLVLDDGTRERPKWILGPLATCDENVKISGITDGGVVDGVQLFDIEALVDDERVHTADNALLPGPGEIQDPVDVAADGDTDGGDLVIVNLTDHTIADSNIGSGPARARFTMNNDGSAVGVVDNFTGTGAGTYANEWLQFSPAETSTCALFEARATVISGAFNIGTAGVWLNCGSDIFWEVSVLTTGSSAVSFTLEIRLISTEVVQQTRTINLSAVSDTISGDDDSGGDDDEDDAGSDDDDDGGDDGGDDGDDGGDDGGDA